MARPDKQGIDYFSLDTHMEDKIKLVEAKFGMEGYGLLIKLWQKIYSHGYYIEWREEIKLLFSNEVNVDINQIDEVINSCLDWEVFNKNLYEQYNILTSHGIQLRYMKATARRKEVEIIKEFNLLKGKELNKNVVFVDLNFNKENENKNPKSEEVNVNNNPKSPEINDNISEQSKVKESKVKESKVKDHSPAEKKQDDTPDIPYSEIVNHLNERTGSRYRSSTKKTRRLIRARWNEGFRLDDFKTVIDKKCVEWMGDEEMEKYLRPPTLFGTKFESYLNQLSVKNTKKDNKTAQLEELYQEALEEDEKDKGDDPI